MTAEKQVSMAASDPRVGRGWAACGPNVQPCWRVARRTAAGAGLAAMLLLGSSPPFAFAFASRVPHAVADPQDGSFAANTRCPVLPGEEVDPEVSTVFEGQTLGFCCVKCLRKFEGNPGAYREGVASVLPAPVVAASIGESMGDGIGLASVPSGRSGEWGEVGPGKHEHGPEPEEAGEHDPGQGRRAGPPEEHDSEHDHATGHGAAGISRWIAWLGKLHPVVIHFPIAWILLAALVELVALVRRPDWLLPAGRQALRLAALSALLAAPLGWAAASSGSYPTNLLDELFWHRILGTGTASLVTLAAVVSEWGWRTGDRRLFGARRVLVLLAGTLVLVTGHLGGTLVFGEGFLLAGG